MNIYRTAQGCFLAHHGNCHPIPVTIDDLLRHEDLHGFCHGLLDSLSNLETRAESEIAAQALVPIGSQEVWASGVTYYRSRDARMEESKDAGGGDFYDRVYSATRPELFFKSSAARVVGPGDKVRIRADAKWSVPEPELTLVLSPTGRIIGYTAGNDMSSRDIEGENPLYLPQAKVYDGACALGPSIFITPTPISAAETAIEIQILRSGSVAFEGRTNLTELKRDPQLLADYLFRELSFPDGAFLMTGTGIVPPDSFTLARGDEIRITINPIGTLVNTVA